MLFIPAYLSLVRPSHMTDTPSVRFASRPEPPQVGTPTYERWSKESAIAFDGGTFTATYGNLIQTLAVDAIGFNCNAPTKQVSVTSSTVVRTIGGASSTRAAYSYTKKQFNKKNSGQAAAGEQVRIVTSVGEYIGRLTGSMEAFATYLCDNQNSIYDAITVYSPRGAMYGPFAPTA